MGLGSVRVRISFRESSVQLGLGRLGLNSLRSLYSCSF